MDNNGGFYTLKGYALAQHTKITSSMEDYLEMIYRFYLDKQVIRINKLSDILHVRPSSASKMVGNLKLQELVRFEPYGIITMTEKGVALGEYLLFRHQILHDFFCYINNSSNELEQVEKVEHFIDPKTIYSIKSFLDRQKDENGNLPPSL